MSTTAAADRPSLDDALMRELEALHEGLCKALNEPKRLAILWLLRDGACSVGALAEALGAPQANVSQHLAVLRERGLVAGERQGTTVAYSLQHPRLLDAVEILREVQRDELARRRAALQRS